MSSFRNKNWSIYAGFFIALVFFLLSFSAISGASNYPSSVLGSLVIFRSLFPYYFPSVAVLWFIAFAIIGFFEDVEGKAMGFAYALTIVVTLAELAPLLAKLPSDRLATALFNIVLWPITLIQEGEWGNLLALAGLGLFGTVAGNLTAVFLRKKDVTDLGTGGQPRETTVTFDLFGKTYKQKLSPQEVERLRQTVKESESRPQVCPNCNAKGKLVFMKSFNQYYCKGCKKWLDIPGPAT